MSGHKTPDGYLGHPFPGCPTYLKQASCQFLQLLLQLCTHLAKPFTLLVLQLQLLGAGRRLSDCPKQAPSPQPGMKLRTTSSLHWCLTIGGTLAHAPG